MLTLLIIVFLFSLVLLPVGIFKPALFRFLLKERATRLNVGLILGVLVVVLAVIVAALAPKEKSTQTQTTPLQVVATDSTKPRETKKTEVPKINYSFDVPSLVGKNIDQVRAILGEPTDGAQKEPTKQQIELGGFEWNNTFTKNGKNLLVTYNSTSRKIVDFFIDTDDSSGKTKDKSHLLELGNLKDNASNYKVEFVKSNKYQDYFTGVKAVPN